MKRFLTSFAALAAMAAVEARAADIMVSDAWARASAGMAKAGAAYMTVHNKGGADRLVGATADVGMKAELHTHIHDGGVMKMRRVEAVDIPADGMAVLEPGGDHVMFMGLKAPLKEGAMFPLTLTFEKAGDVTVQVHVGSAGAMGAMGKPMNHSGHMPMKHNQ